MRRSPLLAPLAPFLAALLLTAGCGPADEHPAGAATIVGPPPTEHRLDPDAEERQKERRRAWFEERHKAPPEVDWREVERRNGLAQVRKRNALALGQPPPGQEDARTLPAATWVERGSEN